MGSKKSAITFKISSGDRQTLCKVCATTLPLPSNRHHRSSGDCLEGKGETIRSALCNIVCNNCAQCDAHTYEQTNSSFNWVLSNWAHFTVLRSCHAHCPAPFRPRLPCSYLAKSRPQPGCLPVTSSPPDSALTRY